MISENYKYITQEILNETQLGWTNFVYLKVKGLHLKFTLGLYQLDTYLNNVSQKLYPYFKKILDGVWSTHKW